MWWRYVWRSGKRRTKPRQALRVLLLNERDQLLADLAAKIPGARCISRTRQYPDFQRVLLRISNLEGIDLPIPVPRCLQETGELGAQRVERHGVVDVEKHGADNICRGTGPVLK